MGWWRDFVLGKEETAALRNPTIQPNKPWPRVEEGDFVILPKGATYNPPKNISEPVYAIVKAMQERPSTFKSVTTKHASDLSYSYTVKDIKTGQSLTVASETRLWWADGYIIRYMYSWAWLTEDEGELLHTTFVEINKKKMERKSNIERARMKGIYK